MSTAQATWDRIGGDPAASERVLVFTENVNATYFISFEVPFTAISKRRTIGWWVVASANFEHQLARANVRDLLERMASDVRPTCVVLTRYALPAGPEILDFFRRCGVRCVYHIDDDLLGLSAGLGSEVLARHGKPDVIAARRMLIEGADLVYASTRPLVDVLKAQFPRQIFSSGIYRAYQPGNQGTQASTSPVVIGYMGSRGHAEDLEIVVPAILRLLRAHGSAIRFELFGTIPFPGALAPFRASILHHKATTDYFEFSRMLNQLGWHIGLAPLADNVFNRCKAPTKFIEYTEAGIATVASDVDVYRQCLTESDASPGAALCRDNDWFRTLDQLVADASARADLLARAKEYCNINFPVSRLAAQVERLVLVDVGVKAKERSPQA